MFQGVVVAVLSFIAGFQPASLADLAVNTLARIEIAFGSALSRPDGRLPQRMFRRTIIGNLASCAYAVCIEMGTAGRWPWDSSDQRCLI